MNEIVTTITAGDLSPIDQAVLEMKRVAEHSTVIDDLDSVIEKAASYDHAVQRGIKLRQKRKSDATAAERAETAAIKKLEVDLSWIIWTARRNRLKVRGMPLFQNRLKDGTFSPPCGGSTAVAMTPTERSSLRRDRDSLSGLTDPDFETVRRDSISNGQRAGPKLFKSAAAVFETRRQAAAAETRSEDTRPADAKVREAAAAASGTAVPPKTGPTSPAARAKAEIQRLKIRIGEMEQEHADQLFARDTEIAHLRSQLEERDERIALMADTADDSDLKNGAELRQLHKLQEERRALRASANSEKAQRGEAERLLAGARRRITALEKQNGELETRVREFEAV